MSQARRLILASTSRYRGELLSRLGVAFEAMAPDCDEDRYKDRGLAPRELARTLARAKAESVHRSEPEAWVLGGDQVCSFGDEILGKPGTEERARAMLSRLQGNEHQLFTAVHLLGPGTDAAHLDVTRLRMRPLDRDQVARVVAADHPVDCAGAYKLEQRGITLFEEIQSEDHTAVTGMPLIAVTNLLRAAGFALP